MFRKCEWNARPPEVARSGSEYVVARNVTETERDGATVYIGEIAYMDAASYAAYTGASAVAIKREQDIVDETVLNLINEGSL